MWHEICCLSFFWFLLVCRLTSVPHVRRDRNEQRKKRDSQVTQCTTTLLVCRYVCAYACMHISYYLCMYEYLERLVSSLFSFVHSCVRGQMSCVYECNVYVRMRCSVLNDDVRSDLSNYVQRKSSSLADHFLCLLFFFSLVHARPGVSLLLPRGHSPYRQSLYYYKK